MRVREFRRRQKQRCQTRLLLDMLLFVDRTSDMFMLVDKEEASHVCLCPAFFSKNKRRFWTLLSTGARPESKRSKFHARFPRTGITDSSKIPRATNDGRRISPRHKNLETDVTKSSFIESTTIHISGALFFLKLDSQCLR